jgi:hypothetical protein
LLEDIPGMEERVLNNGALDEAQEVFNRLNSTLTVKSKLLAQKSNPSLLHVVRSRHEAWAASGHPSDVMDIPMQGLQTRMRKKNSDVTHWELFRNLVVPRLARVETGVQVWWLDFMRTRCRSKAPASPPFAGLTGAGEFF